MNAEPNDDDDAAAGDSPMREDIATIATCVEAMEDSLERMAAAMEKPAVAVAAAPLPAPVVNVAPQIHVPPAAKAPAWEFIFHRDGEGRLCGCTANPRFS